MPRGDTQLGLRARSPGGSEARPAPSGVELLWPPFPSSLEEECSLVSADEAPRQLDSSRILPFFSSLSFSPLFSLPMVVPKGMAAW